MDPVLIAMMFFVVAWWAVLLVWYFRLKVEQKGIDKRLQLNGLLNQFIQKPEVQESLWNVPYARSLLRIDHTLVSGLELDQAARMVTKPGLTAVSSVAERLTKPVPDWTAAERATWLRHAEVISKVYTNDWLINQTAGQIAFMMKELIAE